MAIAAFYEIPGMTEAQYDQLMSEAFHDRLGAGVISHSAGPMDGGWWAMDVFESQEAADAVTAQVGPGLQKLGVSAEPSIKVHAVHNVLVRQDQ